MPIRTAPPTLREPSSIARGTWMSRPLWCATRSSQPPNVLAAQSGPGGLPRAPFLVCRRRTARASVVCTVADAIRVLRAWSGFTKEIRGRRRRVALPPRAGERSYGMRLGMAARARLLVVGLLMAVIAPWSVSQSRAEDGSVLRKGVGRVTLDSLFYLPVEQRYNPHGATEDLATDFNNRRLDSTIFSLLTPLNPFVPGGNASIGDSHVKYKYLYNIEDLGGQYGLTDRLTIGIDIPYFWASNSVEAGLNSGPGSSANVVLNTSSAALIANPFVP